MPSSTTRSQSAKDPCSTRARIALPVLATNDGAAIRPSRMRIRRAFVLGFVVLLMAAHYTQWRIMGTTVSPIEPSETMYTLQRGFVNAGFIFFTLAILATLVFGRFVCGWGCHIVALQDASGWLLQKVGLKPRPFRSRLLLFVPLAAFLYMFVWPTVARYFAKPADEPLWPQFTNHLITTEYWATFPNIWVAIPFLFICGCLTVYFLGNKGFCTYACPYGGIFVLADKVAPVRIRVTDACNQCGQCTTTCMANVQVHAEVKEYGMVIDPGCMKHMDCISVCPNDALYLGFGKPAILPRLGASSADATPRTAPGAPQLSWPEEILAAIVFAASLFAVWDVYQLVPMLMALGIAAVTTFLALRVISLVRRPDISFYKWRLRSEGRLRPAAWVFIAGVMIWTLVVAHSGLVRYHESVGTAAYARIQVPDELALAQADPAEWLTAPDRTNIAAAKKHLYNAFDAGFVVNTDVVTRLAWVEFLSGNSEQSLRMFGIAIARQQGPPRALSRYYRGAILDRLGRYETGLADLDAAIAEQPDLIAAREERGVALWHLGRRADAIAAWREAAAGNAVLANYMLAGADTSSEDGSSFEARADAVAPNDAYFHWMVGMRLRDLGMKQAAEGHFQQAVQLDPTFILRRRS